MTGRFAAFLAAAMFFGPALAEPLADRWNLADLYPSATAWNADAAKLEAQMTELAGCKDHLGDSAARFKQCLDLRADMQKRLNRMAVYAFEQVSEDTGNPAYLELRQKFEVYSSKLDEASAFVNPEVLRIGNDKIGRFIAEDKGLAIYRHPLDEILRAAPHTLNDDGEALVAQFGLMQGAGGSVYSILTNADFPWPTVKLSTGEEIRLDASAYTKYRELPNRDNRKRVMDAFFGTYKTYEQTLGITLYSQLKEDAVLSKVRKYPDSITRVLDRDRMPIAVMDTLIAQANGNLASLHRYFRLRAKMLNVPQLQYYDIYPPLVHSDIKFPLATAKQLTLEAVAPLGQEYVSTLAKGFDSRWMDAYPRPKKQSGAHMDGYAYDVHPYVLLNYKDAYGPVTRVAHQWGCT